MEQTINQEAAGSSPEAPLSSPGGELISTVEFRTQETDATVDVKTDDKQADQDSASEDQQDGAKGKSQRDHADRLDQHPRFKEVIREKNDLKQAVADLTAKVETLSTRGDTKEQPKGFDVDGLDDTAIFEKLNNNPKEFLGDFAKKIEQDLLAKIGETSRAESAKNQVVSAYEQYAQKNPDFDEMWDSGQIQEFIAKNPAHNAISAHMALTNDKRIEEATAKAVKEAVEKTIKQLQAKRGAAVLSGGPASSVVTGGKVSADLANTKSVGGLTSALAARLERMRASG